jgi:hypothetical protein
LDAPRQAATKEKSKYLTIQQKLEGMKGGSIKGLGTKDVNTLKAPRYPQNKVYKIAYKEGLSKQEDTINKRIKELDDIITTTRGKAQTRAETEITTKTNQLKTIEELKLLLKTEKKLRNY